MVNLGFLLGLVSTKSVIGRASIVVECSTAEVFKFIGDNFFQNYPKWSPEVVELKQITPGPVKIGTIAQQVRIDAGHRYENNFKITIYEQNSRLGFMGISDPFRCFYDLQDIDSGKSTRLTFKFELLKLSFVMRPFEVLIRRTIKDGVERTVKNIKQLIETTGSM
jgi:hypothetical protein